MHHPPLSLALVGLGRANQARQRAALAFPQLAQVAATVSRRPGVGSHSWQDVLADANIDAVCIATENASHAQFAREALQAGKHVLVDFPLATTAAEAAELLALAHTHNRVLHTESIGLLTAEHQALRALHARDPLVSAEVEFSANLDGWVLQEAQHGRLGNLGIGRLQALWDLFGPLELQSVYAQRFGDAFDATTGFGAGYRIDAILRAKASGSRVHWSETRRPGLGRGRSWQGTHASGQPLQMPAAGEVTGLFAQDLEHFVARIGGTSAGYVSDDAVLGVLRLAEAMDLASAQPAGQA